MKKLFNILIGLVVAVFFIVAILLLISTFKIPGLPLDARAVLTGSMEPAIPTGSIVFIYPRDSYSEGEIITFKRTNSELEVPITHRIIGVASPNGNDGLQVYETKGDANAFPDADVIKQDEVYGQVFLHIPYIGRLLDLVKTPFGFAALIIIPALLVIADEIKKIVGYVREKPKDINTEEKKD